MEHVLSESLKKFKDLVEKDLTGLATAWSLIDSLHGDLVVKALLLEKRLRSAEYGKVNRTVNCLESLTRYPGRDTDFLPLYKKATAHRDKLLENVIWRTGGVKSQVVIDHLFCRLAGSGNYVRGKNILGIKATGDLSTRQCARDMVCFLKEFGEGSQLLADSMRFLSNTGSRSMAMFVRNKGNRPADKIKYFTDLCVRVFLQGKRVNILELGRYSKHRHLYRELLGGYSSGQLSAASRVMTPLCRYVHMTCFGPVEAEVAEGLCQESVYVLDRIAAAIPSIVFNYLHPAGQTMEVPAVPSESSQEAVVKELADAGRPLVNALLTHQGRSVLATRYDHVSSPIKTHSGRVDRRTLGLKGRIGVLSDRSDCYSFTAEELQSYSWFLAPKDLALFKLLYVDGVRQWEAAACMGVTQGGVAHRVIKARTSIRLLSGMGRMPNEMEIAALVHTYLPVETEWHRRDPVLILMAMVHARGKQTLASALSGIGQPVISLSIKRYSRYLVGKEIPAEHRRAADFVLLVHKYPYAFQDVELPHFPWNMEAIAENQLESQKKKDKK